MHCASKEEKREGEGDGYQIAQTCDGYASLAAICISNGSKSTCCEAFVKEPAAEIDRGCPSLTPRMVRLTVTTPPWRWLVCILKTMLENQMSVVLLTGL